MFAEQILTKFDRLVRRALIKSEVSRPTGPQPRLGRMEDTDCPLELACAGIVRAMPDEERAVLTLTYGLSGHAPCPPHRAADILGWGLACTLTIGEGAILRLRNSTTAREAFAPLLARLRQRLLVAADEIYELRLAEAPRAKREMVLKQLWCELSPIERLCLRGFGEGEIEEMRYALEGRAAGLI